MRDRIESPRSRHDGTAEEPKLGEAGTLLRVLCLSVWPHDTAPALRFRCEAYFADLRESGFAVDQASFFSHAEYKSIRYSRSIRSIWTMLRGFFRQLLYLTKHRDYDVVWLLREAAPIGPPIIEEVIIRLFKVPIVFDFDDAIWIGQDDTPISAWIRCRSKTKRLIQNSAHVMAGNTFLASYAEKLNPKTSVVPTCVDTVGRFNVCHVHRQVGRPCVGWTGSHSTNRYLESLSQILQEGVNRQDYNVVVISDQRPSLPFAFQYYGWSAISEIDDLQTLDVGLMPLGDSVWERGKCGFKLIQYMALGIPPIASEVGANRDIVRHGIDGFLCRTETDWISALKTLCSDAAMRAEMGANGRCRVSQHFSTASQIGQISDILRSAARSRPSISRTE